MRSLILQENSFQFNGKDFLLSHGTAMGTKMAVAFANILGHPKTQTMQTADCRLQTADHVDHADRADCAD